MTKKPRWVCDSCKGVWFNAPLGKCPSCGGTGKERTVEVDAGGVVDPKQLDFTKDA